MALSNPIFLSSPFQIFRRPGTYEPSIGMCLAMASTIAYLVG
jgi:hypothetical protein